MKLTLINPRFPESFWSHRWILRHILPDKKALNPPLGLATVAALCPEDWEVEIIDENIENIPLDLTADIVGICGMGVQFARQAELLSYYRKRGHFVVAGGSYASLCPEAYEGLADAVVAGEAEYIWPEFCRDLERGRPRNLYQETGTVSLADSPVPRFDLLRLDRYMDATLQFSRGCPFECEFCDIIVMFGRKPRTKPLELVGKELDRLRELGVRKVFFTDDNLIGNKAAAKELFRFLIAYQERHGYRFRFGTEASINLAYDEELLGLFKQAGFEWVFIGIESPEEDNLRETGKKQNLARDLLDSVRRIYAEGIDVIAGFIIGFDHDTPETFERQYRFILDSGIQAAMVGLLTAIPKTPLHARLEREGRLVQGTTSVDNSKLMTNVIPKNMSYDEMIEGYRRLHFRLFDDEGIAQRIRNKLRYLGRRETPEYRPREAVALLWRFLSRGLLPGGPRRFFRFLRTLPLSRPEHIPQVINDWIVGLSTRDYVERHFGASTPREMERIRGTVERLQELVRGLGCREAVRVSLRMPRGGLPAINVSLRGGLEKDSVRKLFKTLEAVLKETRASLQLNIREFNQAQAEAFRTLLGRLAAYGDRIQVHLDEPSRKLLPLDSSVFHLSLEEA
jgi:radical SAM superfamily enzyme YgiQ (UPF0313 family)